MSFFDAMTKEVNVKIALSGSFETFRPLIEEVLEQDRNVRAAMRGRLDDFRLDESYRLVLVHHLRLTNARGFRCRVFVAWLDPSRGAEADEPRLLKGADAVLTDPTTMSELEAIARTVVRELGPG